MRKIVGALLILAGLHPAIAQTTEGKIVYEQKVDLHRRIPEDNQHMRSMVPPSRTTKYELHFADNQSLFKAIEEEPDMTEQNNGGVVIRIGGSPENEYYKNFSTKKLVEKRELMQEMYLLEDSIKSISWKLEEGETKTILGHLCHKATAKTARGFDIEAWYADDISLSSGPQGLRGLPGLVLMTDINKSEFVTTAVEFRNTLKKSELRAPNNGKKVSEAEFAKIVKDAFGDQNGGVRIVTNDN